MPAKHGFCPEFTPPGSLQRLWTAYTSGSKGYTCQCSRRNVEKPENLGILVATTAEYTGVLQKARPNSIGSNALASSIVLVCRPVRKARPQTTRKKFVQELQEEVRTAIKVLTSANTAPVDVAQAAIGPGMAVFTRYERIIDARGNRLSVSDALSLTNKVLDDITSEEEGDLDTDSRWSLSWFKQHGFAEGTYGDAEQLSKAKNTSVSGLVEAGVLISGGGAVRLLKPEELPEDWDPEQDMRLTAWETVHHLIRALDTGGEMEAANIIARLGAGAESARDLCYRLYVLCERSKRMAEGFAYNRLVQSWPEITRLAKNIPHEQGTLDLD